MYVYRVCAWYLKKSGENVRAAEATVTDGCELVYGCWEKNPQPLEEQPVRSPFSHPSGESRCLKLSMSLHFLNPHFIKIRVGFLILNSQQQALFPEQGIANEGLQEL